MSLAISQVAGASLDPFVSGEERRSTTHYVYASGAWTSVSGKHAFVLKVQGSAPTRSGWDCTSSTLTISTGGSTALGGYDEELTSPISGNDLVMRLWSPSGGANLVEVHVLAGTDNVVSGGTVSFVVKNYWERIVNGQTETDMTQTTYPYTLTKIVAEADASIDSRKGFAFGNSAPDPNDAERNANFGTSSYKGGLFVGRMLDKGDRSGTARIQMRFPNAGGETTGFKFAVLSMFHLPPPSQASEAIYAGTYLPRSDDTNLAFDEGSLTWANRWDIVPQELEYEYEGDYPYHMLPLSILEVSNSSPNNEYLNWDLTQDADQEDRPYSYTNVAVVLYYESGQTGIKNWRYFASREYESQIMALSALDETAKKTFRDTRPRLWILKSQ
ncbi:MAG: hypothetical protein HONBIEJF_00340 [Fimbriimonadaceae bacterium]|nr:hypothetical protein [Fimbriimonadaceae bacterium]